MMAFSLENVVSGFGDIGTSFFAEPALLWQLVPIVLIWFLLEIYFGIRGNEKLEWNAALVNGISLLWIVVSGMQYIFSDSVGRFSWTTFIIIALLGLYDVFIIVTTFMHAFSKKVEFVLASPTLIYYFSVIILLIAYNQIFLSLSMVISILLLFLFFTVFFWIVRRIIPTKKAKSESEDSLSSSKDSDSSGSESFSDLSSSEGTSDSGNGSGMSDMSGSEGGSVSSSINPDDSMSSNGSTTSDEDESSENPDSDVSHSDSSISSDDSRSL